MSDGGHHLTNGREALLLSNLLLQLMIRNHHCCLCSQHASCRKMALVKGLTIRTRAVEIQGANCFALHDQRSTERRQDTARTQRCGQLVALGMLPVHDDCGHFAHDALTQRTFPRYVATRKDFFGKATARQHFECRILLPNAQEQRAFVRVQLAQRHRKDAVKHLLKSQRTRQAVEYILEGKLGGP